MKKMMVILAAVLMAAFMVQADILVQWGTDAGVATTDIVTANQNFRSRPNTYTTVTNQPVANYYPNSTGRSPAFSAAASVNNFNGLAEQASSGDRLTMYASVAAGATFRGMVMWQSADYLIGTSNFAVSNVVLDINQRSNASSANQEIRVVIQQGLNYYVSGAQSFNATMATKTFNLTVETWYNFTPFVFGVETIGTAATVSLTDVEAIGYYFTVQNGGAAAANTGAQVQFFSVNGSVIPEPATIGMLGLGGFVTLLVRRMNRGS